MSRHLSFRLSPCELSCIHNWLFPGARHFHSRRATFVIAIENIIRRGGDLIFFCRKCDVPFSRGQRACHFELIFCIFIRIVSTLYGLV